MKVPPKRKGNTTGVRTGFTPGTLNESPSEKEGKYKRQSFTVSRGNTLNESPSEKEGKSRRHALHDVIIAPQ